MKETPTIEHDSFVLARDLFIRFMGIIYLVAFLSLNTQVLGLYGKKGIQPVSHFMGMAEHHFGAKAFFKYPTFFWFNSSDQALTYGCWIGIVFAILAIIGITPAFSLLMLWLTYLSYQLAGQDFLSFQWDILLLEAGFLSIFLCPWSLFLHKTSEAPSRWMRFLIYVVLFKLMVQSGLVKLLSEDPTWHSLTALDYHYWTQPIPNPLSWYAHQLPVWIDKLSVLLMLIIEILVPLGFFIHRYTRRLACFLQIAFQGILILTGNYTFFNWLTIALCILLIDDEAMKKITPRFLHSYILLNTDPDKKRLYFSYVKCGICWMVVALILSMNIISMMGTVNLAKHTPRFILEMHQHLRPYSLSNSYGLFARMTTTRPEIIIEGSNDGLNWLTYEFPYKVGQPDRRPKQIAPFQARVDWQLWFAALGGNYQRSPWFMGLVQRILQGSPSVLQFLETNPFPDAPPKFIRAKLYSYEFTTSEERKKTSTGGNVNTSVSSAHL